MARLPQPGGDNGNWGNVLNDYLSQAHKPDGTLKDDSVTSATIADGTVQETQLSSDVVAKLNAPAVIPDGSVAKAKLQGDVQTSLGKADSALQAADIAGKADDAAVLHKAGTETITGSKDFTGGITINGTNIVVGTDSRLTDARTPLDNSVSTAKLQDGGVTSAKIADGTITGADISATAGITKTQLESGVQTSLGKADSALQKATADTLYAGLPTGTPNAGFIPVYDSSSATTMRWSNVQAPTGKAVGWAIVTDTQWAGGADASGAADCTAAIAAAAASTSTCIYFPPGTYLLSSSLSLNAFSGKVLLGAGRNLTVFKVGSGVTTAAFLASSGAAVSDLTIANLTIDCAWTSGATVLNAIQITNGARIRINSVAIKNSGGAGILLQGLNAGGGTPDSRVEECRIDGCGLADGTTGHAVWLKDASTRSVVARCRITNVKGGMGIGLSGAAGTGYPTYCRIVDNTIDMASSTTGFEGIGLTAGCTNAVISANTVFNTYDNGISVTASYCTVTGNNVDGTYNHGITAGGDGLQVVGNFVRNVGKENPALGFGGICLDTGASNCVVMGNRVVDDQGTHTMAYGVKINSSGGNNRIGPNSMAGWLTSAYNGLLSTDLNIDAESYTNGFSFPRVYTDFLASKTASGSISVSSTMYLTNQIVVGSGAAKTSQLTVYSNAGSTRANAALAVATGQVADVLDIYNPGGSVVASITKDGAFKPLAVATSSRPTAATVGAGGMIFDTTLNKPIWSTGSAWVDATGATV